MVSSSLKIRGAILSHLTVMQVLFSNGPLRCWDLILARASPATEVRPCESLSIRPRVGRSKTYQRQHNDVANNTLHRPRVGGWATFGYSSRLHRHKVGAG